MRHLPHLRVLCVGDTTYSVVRGPEADDERPGIEIEKWPVRHTQFHLEEELEAVEVDWTFTPWALLRLPWHW